MPATPSTRSSRSRRTRRATTQSLACPDCGGDLVLSGADLYEGRELECTHCGAALILSRDFAEKQYDYRWVLEPADDVFDEDRDHE